MSLGFLYQGTFIYWSNNAKICNQSKKYKKSLARNKNYWYNIYHKTCYDK